MMHAIPVTSLHCMAKATLYLFIYLCLCNEDPKSVDFEILKMEIILSRTDLGESR